MIPTRQALSQFWSSKIPCSPFSELHNISRSTDIESLKLGKGSSGRIAFLKQIDTQKPWTLVVTLPNFFIQMCVRIYVWYWLICIYTLENDSGLEDICEVFESSCENMLSFIFTSVSLNQYNSVVTLTPTTVSIWNKALTQRAISSFYEHTRLNISQFFLALKFCPLRFCRFCCLIFEKCLVGQFRGGSNHSYFRCVWLLKQNFFYYHYTFMSWPVYLQSTGFDKSFSSDPVKYCFD